MKTLTQQRIQIFEMKASMLGPASLEDEHQPLVAEYLDALGLLWCHIPNGGHRHKAVAAKLKAQGVKPGVPDNFIFDPPLTRRFSIASSRPSGFPERGVAIELKRPRADGWTLDRVARRTCSSVSKDQRAWIAGLIMAGWLVEVCFGFDEVRALCRELGYER